MANPEFTSQLPNPEIKHISPERALYDAVRASYSDIPDQQATLTHALEAAKATRDVTDELTIDVVGGVLQSMLFGDYGTPLPTGLVHAVRYDELPHRTYISEDPAFFKMGDLFGRAHDGSGGVALGGRGIVGQLLDHGLSDLMKLRAEQRSSNAANIIEASRNLILSQPAIQLLQSFNTSNPVQHRETPLTNTEIASRASTLRNRAEHSLGPLAFEPDARQVITRLTARPIYALDQERVMRRAPDKQDGIKPFARLRRYLLKTAFEMLAEAPGNEELRLSAHDENSSIINSPKGLLVEHKDKTYVLEATQLADRITTSMVPYTSLYFDMNREIVKGSILTFFTSGNISYENFMSELVSVAWERAFEPMTETFYSSLEHHYDGWPQYLRLNGYQAAPWVHTKEHLDTIKPKLNPLTERVANFVDKANYLHEKSTVTGSVWIDKRYADAKPRMMEYVPVDTIDLPRTADNVVMTVQHYNTGTWDGTTIPKVDGYITVSYDPTEATFGFAPDARGDICAERCNVLLPEAGKAQAAASCATMGLNTVADYANRTPQVTVAQLVDRLQAASRYAIPSTASTLALTKPEDFIQCVIGGTLYVQCSISRDLAVLIFKPVFGEGSVRIRNGVLIDGKASQTLTLATHTNIVLTVEGREYSIDLTPSRVSVDSIGASIGSLTRFLLGARTIKRSRPANGVIITPPTTILDIRERADSEREYVAPEDVRKVEVTQAINSLTADLLRILEVNTVDKLHHTLHSSPSYYPILQVLRLAASAREDQLSQAAVAEYLTLLDNIQFPKIQRTAREFKKFSPELLDTLRAHIHTLPVIGA